MGILIFIILGIICAPWAGVLASSKGKKHPILWFLAGLFFNLLPVMILSALHTPDELKAIKRTSEKTTPTPNKITDEHVTNGEIQVKLNPDKHGTVKTRQGPIHSSNIDIKGSLNLPVSKKDQQWFKVSGFDIHISSIHIK